MDEPVKLPTVIGSSEPATNSIESHECSILVPAAHLVTASNASCQVVSATNSMDDDDLASCGDGLAAKQGLKRRWSFEGNTVCKRAFQGALLEKQMPSGELILSVSNEMKTRGVAQIRTPLNNIMLGKQKWF